MLDILYITHQDFCFINWFVGASSFLIRKFHRIETLVARTGCKDFDNTVADDATKAVNVVTKLVVKVKLDQRKDYLFKRNLTGNEPPLVH